MKNMRYIGCAFLMLGMLIVGSPVYAQQLEWRSTSTMRGAGSAYSPQITAVGATTVSGMATTTSDYLPTQAQNNGPRKGFGKPDDPGHQSNEYPIGDALIPLSLLAFAFAGFIAFRRRKSIGNFGQKEK